MTEVSPRVAARAAFLAAGLNLAAAAAMLLLLRPGLPAGRSGLHDRVAYVAGHTAAWWAGWLFWHAAAIALLGFYLGLAGLWWRSAPARCGLALLCATAGLAADLSAEAIYMGVAPRLPPEGFAAAEATAAMLTGYVGNGLYTVAGMLLTWAGAGQLPPRLLALSVPVWAAGLSLSAASLANSATGQAVSTGILMPLFVLWAGLTGKWLAGRAS